MEVLSVIMVCVAMLTIAYVIAEVMMYGFGLKGNSEDYESDEALDKLELIHELKPHNEVSMSLEERNALNQAFFDCYVDAMQTRDWINRAIDRDDMHLYQQRLLMQERAHIESLLEQINSDDTEYDEASLEATRRTQKSIYDSVSAIMGTVSPA